MKKITILFCSFLLIILHFGCTKIMFYQFGVRNPKVENKKSILDYLTANNLSTENSFCLQDTAALTKFYNRDIGTPEIRFYDRNGYLMLYRDNKKCNAQNDSLITFLNPKNVIKIDSTNNLSEYLKQIKTLDGKDINPDEFKGYDYYLIMYWAKWTGKVNKIKMEDWEKSIVNKNDPKIKTIKVTTDYMDFWPLEKSDMIKIYSHKTKTTGKKH
ncbi:MAG: hypothetical protein NTX97_13055 [Bacteroidetes bacterium]|nr:hypothetical protein [Bacteroidota bacterium]